MGEKFRAFYGRYRPFCIVGGIAVLFAVTMLLAGGFLVNIGFLIFGSLIALGAGLVGDTFKRPQQATDLAAALYVELADRVARCCYDVESPWGQYLNPTAPVQGWNAFRLRKFSPVPPSIYTVAASQLALLDRDAAQAVMQFYFRLSAWARDIENIAAASQGHAESIDTAAIRFLAQRLHQTLSPGLRALQTLAPAVNGFEAIEATAIAGYDGARPVAKTLRQRIQDLL